MFRNWTLILTAIVIPGFAWTQGSLSGSVRTADQKPLPGATIYIPELQLGTASAPDGSYALNRLPEKELLVQVSYIGFGTRTERLSIHGDTRFDFVVEETILEAQEVVISGMSPAEEKRLSLLPMEIVRNEELFRIDGDNLVAMLTSIPGVSAIQTGPAIAKPVIRGLSYNRVLVIHDGIRQEGQQWGDEHGLEADPFAADRIELIKGPSSLVYGSDGMGGVINITSESPSEENKLLGDITALFQTGNNRQGYSAFLSANKGGLMGSFRGSYSQADDYRNRYDGKVFNSGSDDHSFDGMAGINRKWGYTHLHVNSFDQHVGLIEGERDSTGAFLADDKPHQRINHFRMSLNNLFFLGRSSLRVNIGFQENRRREYEDEEVPALYMDLETFSYNIRYQVRELGGWFTIAGVSGMYQQNANRSSEALIPDYNLFDIGIFVYAKKEFRKWFFNAGLRWDSRGGSLLPFFNDDGSEKFEEGSFNFSDISASAGASYLARQGLSAKLNLSRGFRFPNLSELASDGVHEGTFRYEYGNLELGTESNLELDAGLEYERPHISLEAALFINRVDAFIHLDKLRIADGSDSLVISDGKSYPAFTYVQADAVLYGGEFLFDVHPHPLHWLHFENSLALVLGDQLEGKNKFLPLIPSPVYRGELKAEIREGGGFLRNAYVSFEAVYHFAQERVDQQEGFETPTPGYLLIGAGFGTDIIDRNGRKLLTMTVTCENLADIAYQDHLSRLKYSPENPATGRAGIYDMGRNIMFRVRIPLSFKI
jgi:iron complex outermembrane receptor protein